LKWNKLTIKHQCFSTKRARDTAISQVSQIRPLADIVYFKYARTYLLTYLLTNT